MNEINGIKIEIDPGIVYPGNDPNYYYGVKIEIGKESESIILSKNGLRYECYFDKKHHSIFVGEPKAGSLINIGTPEKPTGALRIEFYPLF